MEKSSQKKGRNKERRKEIKRGKKEKEGREKKRKRKEDRQLRPQIYRRSNGRNLLGRELKPVYLTRATLQEVGILPPLVISTLRTVWPCFLP